MAKLKRDGNQYVYKNYSVSHAIDGRWYVWKLENVYDFTDVLVADFPTLRDVRAWLYEQEEK